MNILNQTKPESKAQTAIKCGFFWSNNQKINFVKKTNTNGYILEERFKGIIFYPTPDHELKPKYNLTKCFPIKECQYCKPAPNKSICVEGSVIDPICPECGRKILNEDL